jgi:tetratricopeptide (TPR) repeat protein
MRDLPPLAYFFTECRVILIYARMFFLPYGQNVDPDIAISHGVADHGAIFGLLALVAVAAAAWIFRKRWPLASYGVFVFLLLLAPTSSFAPIRDVMAERRMYLPFLGLTLVVLEVLRRVKLQQAIAAGSAALVICTALTYQRSQVWSSALALWTDTSAKSPRKMRPMFHLAFAQFQEGDCGRAATTYEAASHLDAPDYRLLVDWANALSCAGQKDRAVDEYKAAIQLNPGMAEAYVGASAIYGEQRKLDEAMRALDVAQAIDPGIAQIYVNRGGVLELQGERPRAAEQYRKALNIDPANRTARDALQRLGR